MYRIIQGAHSQLVLSAPHAIPHVRDGQVKKAEVGTAEIVEDIASRLGIAAIIAHGKQIPDPSWDVAGSRPFRDAVVDLLAPGSLLLDFHGMKNEHAIDLCIGTGRAPTDLAVAVAADFREAGKRADLRIEIDFPFPARCPERLIAVAADAQAGGLQLEIARRFRNRRTSPESYQEMLRVLIESLAIRIERR